MMNSILSVGLGVQDQCDLELILGHCGWRIQTAAGRVETHRRLLNGSYSAVVCSASLADGDWKDILVLLTLCSPEPSLIVASGCADERLWAEVLNLGGSDVLATPFAVAELLRVTALAARRSAPPIRTAKPPASVPLKQVRRRRATALSSW